MSSSNVEVTHKVDIRFAVREVNLGIQLSHESSMGGGFENGTLLSR